MFIDKAKIEITSGKGGRGCVSFRREKYVPRGGPDGGDGGKGGDVIIKVNPHLNTLLPFKYKRHFKARHGSSGQGANKTGKEGQNCIIYVPCGTIVYDNITGYKIADLVLPEEEVTVASGGKGGRGNTSFKSATNQAPRNYEEGGAEEHKVLRLELKLLADIGIIGFPNAGKSVLISKISSARPKIADYPFTTLSPTLGVVKVDDSSFVIVDIPGIIEGASQGRGKGLQFLSHIERTKILLYLIDISSDKNYSEIKKILTQELKEYSPILLSRPTIFAINKIDLPEVREKICQIKKRHQQDKIFFISALTGEGIKDLIYYIFTLLTLVVEKGLVSSREKARVVILAGGISVEGEKILKPSQTVDIKSKIEIKEGLPYVSRGGEKLEKAIRDFCIDAKDKIALDIGASTGGFTSCLLKFGAKKVHTVDVGYGQLHYKLRQDKRVVCREKINARYLTKDLFQDEIDLATIDVSFISAKKILPPLKNVIKDNGKIILLIKPQFEAERKQGKKGIVKDKNVHLEVICGMINFCQSENLFAENLTYSPIKGSAGNIEYFLLLGKCEKQKQEIEIQNIIDEAHLKCQ